MFRKGFFGVMVLLVGLVLVFALVGCGDPEGGPTGGNPQTVTYTGTANSVTYTLKITENTARYTAQSGDAYELTAGAKKSAGTVSNIAGSVLTLTPSNQGAQSFTTTVSGTGITAMTGTITWNNGSTENAPSTFTGGGGGLVVDMTNINTFLAGYGLTEADVKPTGAGSAKYAKHVYNDNTADISYEKQMTRQDLFVWAVQCMKAIKNAADNGKIYSLDTNNGSLTEFNPDELTQGDIVTGSAELVSLSEFLAFYRQGQRTSVNLLYTEVRILGVSKYDVTIQIGPY